MPPRLGLPEPGDSRANLLYAAATRETVGPNDSRVDPETAHLLIAPVVSRVIVDACTDLRISLVRRTDVDHILVRFDEAKSRVTASTDNLARSDSTAGDAAGAPPAGGAAGRASRGGPASSIVSGGSRVPAPLSLERLQVARNTLLEAALPSAQKLFFGSVPREWLSAAAAFCRIIVLIGLLCAVPSVATQLDCSDITCGFNNASLSANSTARTYRLHSVTIGRCPFPDWLTALFGAWLLIFAAGVFGFVIFVWIAADAIRSPLATRVRPSIATFVATLSTVPYRTRLFVVGPPLVGMGATGVMVWARIRADAAHLTWSWGAILAPLITGYGCALVLKLYVSWQYINHASASQLQVSSALPSSWAKTLLIVDALAMTCAAFTSPSVAAKMADCEGYVNWDAMLVPVLLWQAIGAATTLVEVAYKISQGRASDESGGSIWRDVCGLVTKQASLIVGMSLVYVKLSYTEYAYIDWILVVIPFIVYCAVAFVSSVAVCVAAVRKSQEQFCSLETLLTRSQIEESLASGYQHAVDDLAI